MKKEVTINYKVFIKVYRVYTSVNKIGKIKKVRVATSDALEQTIILGKGATRLSARELKNEIETFKRKQHQNYKDTLPIKNNMLEDNVAPEIRKWMEEFRRQ